jgi:hypothetical protein
MAFLVNFSLGASATEVVPPFVGVGAFMGSLKRLRDEALKRIEIRNS